MSDSRSESGLPARFEENGPVVRVRGRSREVQVCPVCSGRGSLPQSFYDPSAMPSMFAALCRSCEGKGSVIVDV